MRRARPGMILAIASVVILALTPILLAMSIRTSEGWTTMQGNLVALGVTIFLFGSITIALLWHRAS